MDNLDPLVSMKDKLYHEMQQIQTKRDCILFRDSVLFMLDMIEDIIIEGHYCYKIAEILKSLSDYCQAYSLPVSKVEEKRRFFKNKQLEYMYGGSE